MPVLQWGSAEAARLWRVLALLSFLCSVPLAAGISAAPSGKLILIPEDQNAEPGPGSLMQWVSDMNLVSPCRQFAWKVPG